MFFSSAHPHPSCSWLRPVAAAVACAAVAVPALAQPGAADTTRHRGLWQRLKSYMSLDADSSQSPSQRSLDMLGGAYYDNVWGVTASVLGQAHYRMPGATAEQQPSSAKIFGEISLKGFWSVGLRGTNLWPNDKARLTYNLELSYEPSYFWGMGYLNGDNDDNKTKQHKHKVKISTLAMVRVAPNCYVGPALKWNYTRAAATERPWLYEGQDSTQHNLALGVVGELDTRDNIDNPTRGAYVHLEQTFSPKWLGTGRGFATTIAQADAYRTAWTGAVLAAEAYAELNFGHPSWATMAQVGNSYRMRGYYDGRYRDKHMIAVQAELRQHLWGRHSMAVWAGGGTIFHNGHIFSHILPNAGFGYRFLFRRGTLVRLDLGVGRSWQTGFTINVNEAF